LKSLRDQIYSNLFKSIQIYSENPAMNQQEAHLLLKQFDCLNPRTPETKSEWEQLRQALLHVAEQSDYQMLGICADSLFQGQRALETYAAALGHQPDPHFNAVEGAVYIKFNPKSGLCYADSYQGEHRGVLVSCQSADESGLNEMYGHLPLDLFEEG
jgi:hypothetical protein